MFRQVFRVAFVTLIWKQYKHVIVSTLLLFLYLFLVSSIHSDYLTHTRLQKDATGSGLSFVYKWAAFALGTGLYFLYHYVRGKKQRKSVSKGTASKGITGKEMKKNMEATVDEDDPFSEIRARQKLRSRADFLDGKD